MMYKRLLLSVFFVLLLGTVAAQAFWHGVYSGACTNSLVFSATCNSQYVSLVLQ
jgi:hypothetical protein